MTNPLKRFVDYAIDRGADRIAERLFDRYGDDASNLITNITGMFTAAVPVSSVKPPEAPPAPGLRLIGDDE